LHFTEIYLSQVPGTYQIVWRPFAHVAVDYQPLTALEQWKASRHRLLWVAVVNRYVGKRDAPIKSK